MTHKGEGLPEGGAEKESRRFESGSETLSADRHPGSNEDRVLNNSIDGLFGVFDGVSVPPSSDASRTASEVIERELSGKEFSTLDEVKEKMRDAIMTAHRAVQERGSQIGSKIGTTASIVQCWRSAEGKQYAVIGNVGDSRAYILESGGSLKRLTIDDLMYLPDPKAEILDAIDRAASFDDLDPTAQGVDQVKNFISQMVGQPDDEEHLEFSPRIQSVKIHPGDILLLSSDGAHDNLTREEIEAVLVGHSSPEAAAQELARASKERSRDKDHFRSKDDDISALVVRV